MEDMFVHDRKYIVNIPKGLFTVGVKIVDNQVEVHRLVDTIQREVDSTSWVFSVKYFSNDRSRNKYYSWVIGI